MKSFDGYKTSPYCGKCWKLDRRGQMCEKFKAPVKRDGEQWLKVEKCKDEVREVK